jgi:hypothetical protein
MQVYMYFKSVQLQVQTEWQQLQYIYRRRKSATDCCTERRWSITMKDYIQRCRLYRLTAGGSNYSEASKSAPREPTSEPTFTVVLCVDRTRTLVRVIRKSVQVHVIRVTVNEVYSTFRQLKIPELQFITENGEIV